MTKSKTDINHWSDTSLFHIIAHRGASAYAPDNSRESFMLAKQHGATDIEVDVHCTYDGEFIVRHDTTLSSKYISELTYKKYTQICESQLKPPLRLTEILDIAKVQNLGLYIDLKQALPQHLKKLISTIQKHKIAERVVVASFRTDLIKTIKEHAPNLTTSVLLHDPNTDLNSLVKGVNCNFLHPGFDIFPNPLKHFNDEWVRRAKNTGSRLIGWNMKTLEMAKAVIKMNPQGACADDPQLLRDALTETITNP